MSSSNMNIKQGLKLKPPRGSRVVEIPNVTRDDFATFLFENGYKVGVEIGVNKGEYGVTLCKAGLKVYGVDCWENYPGYKRVGTYHSSMDEAMVALKGYDYSIINGYSHVVVQDFEDESLDFVYIDGNHTLPYIVQDIFDWERKVRKGGIISGHDYANISGFGERGENKVWDGCHVRAGVNAACEVMKVDKLYVLGERHTKNRDKWRTFFWIKK